MRVEATREPRRSTSARSSKLLADGRPQVVDAQVDGAELGEAVQPLRRRLVHVARADRGHHGQAGHGVERRR